VIEIVSAHAHQPFEQIKKDIDRDRFLSAEEARDYGLIDEVIAACGAAGLGGYMPELPGTHNGNGHRA
jgi:ATP-dependent Clp protease protease subunit